MNELYQQMKQSNNFWQALNDLKAKGGDPNQMIQDMLNSGKITQTQYNSAVQRAQQIMQMLPTSVRR